MRCVLALILFLAGASLLADEVDDSRRIYKEALAAYEQKDFSTYLARVRVASDLRPSHPGLLVRYAAALALNGQRDPALSALERVASMGIVADVKSSDDFSSLRAFPRFDAVLTRFETNARPMGAGREDFTIEGLGLIPEGMAYDARGKLWFVSSVRARKIFAIDAGGEVRVLAKDLPWGVFGMVFDATRGVLWATTSGLPQVEGLRAEDVGKSGLLKIDPRSGRVLEVLRAPDTDPHHFNDVTLAADGTVYVSDGSTPNIFRVKGKALESFLRGPFTNLQGVAVAGPILYVSDYSKGIFAVDLRTRVVRLLPVPAAVSLLGVDGLYMAGRGTLVATQNGVSPNRILRIRLGVGGLSIASAETLLANAPGLGDPTLGVVAGDRFYFNAIGQWDLFADDGTITDPVQLRNAVVMSVPLR